MHTFNTHTQSDDHSIFLFDKKTQFEQWQKCQRVYWNRIDNFLFMRKYFGFGFKNLGS
jgi:hypothetical protein